MKPRTTQKEKQPPVKIDGLEDFDLGVVGLTPDSIERSGGSIVIPLELVPFLKICKQPAVTRKQKAEEMNRWRLKVRKNKSKKSRKKR